MTIPVGYFLMTLMGLYIFVALIQVLNGYSIAMFIQYSLQ